VIGDRNVIHGIWDGLRQMSSNNWRRMKMDGGMVGGGLG
jgi:hypothetical protein